MRALLALIAVVLAAWFVFCGCIGYGRFISPMEAYQIELKQCEARKEAEAIRRCKVLVGKKYQRYLSEGDYPSPRTPGD